MVNSKKQEVSKGRRKCERKWVESASKGKGQFQKGRRKYEIEGKIFAKLKSTIVVVGQRDSEAGEVDEGKGLHDSRKKS